MRRPIDGDIPLPFIGKGVFFHAQNANMKPMLHFVALVLGIGLVVQAGHPITEYTCRYTGKRLERCCCNGATRTDAPVFERDGCCDVSVTSFDSMPSSSDVKATSQLAPAATVILPMRADFVAPTFIEIWDRDVSRLRRPYDTGPPVYLRARHLLI